MAKKVQRKPHTTNRKSAANTQWNGKRDFYFLLLAEQNNSPIHLHGIYLISVYLTSGSFFVTSAEMYSVVALKGWPKSFGPCVVKWAHWSQSSSSKL